MEVRDVVSDTYSVRDGSIFVCVRGSKHDGHGFAKDAVRSGAVALCVKNPVEDVQVPQVVSSNPRSFMGRLGAVLYGWPSKQIKMIGVTGTNGKTTTTYMIRSIFDAAGIKTGLLGTIFYCDGISFEYADRTTPEGSGIQMFLKRMRDNGCGACVMEASSHGLEQGRLEGCLFDGAVFTNLTPEHLDFHGSIDSYFDAKRKLFRHYMKDGWVGASNASDPWGKRLLDEYGGNMVGYAVIGGQELPQVGAWCGRVMSYGLDGMTLDVFDPQGKVFVQKLSVPLIGEYNAENAMGAIALCASMGIDPSSIRDGIASMPQVPGRLETYRFPNRVVAVIDYAHTPDGLEKVLTALRKVCVGKLWAVFGHGGERSREHRPKLGGVASSLADRVVITMDNPRSEDPEEIARQIESGMASPREGFAHWVIINRSEAIRFAMDNAAPGDLVAITGKGPERFLIFADRKEPFEDRLEVINWGRKHFSPLEWNV
ncbi:MAG: UDP-N-acetylmuramoyl-L-alanyl-D-glutamate--2,6-diaminopimelate ligase [Thermanaerothrix sp.]|nr:UDP-N-acetylmuramoyl-L-alanyl-D-glutamate--2,6-diaminopimelate ligase [Thermanaerothrix sp.]